VIADSVVTVAGTAVCKDLTDIGDRHCRNADQVPDGSR
jgi:hypothetical protein